jgi:hypothetical protein
MDKSRKKLIKKSGDSTTKLSKCCSVEVELYYIQYVDGLFGRCSKCKKHIIV